MFRSTRCSTAYDGTVVPQHPVFHSIRCSTAFDVAKHPSAAADDEDEDDAAAAGAEIKK